MYLVASVCPSMSVGALLFEPFTLTLGISSPRYLCVCNQGAYVDNQVDVRSQSAFTSNWNIQRGLFFMYKVSAVQNMVATDHFKASFTEFPLIERELQYSFKHWPPVAFGKACGVRGQWLVMPTMSTAICTLVTNDPLAGCTAPTICTNYK